MAVVIRKAGVDDAFGVARVEINAWRDAYPTLLPQRYLVKGLNLARCCSGWRRRLGRGRDNILVLDSDDPTDEIVGFATFGPSRKRSLPYLGEINELYLMPDYQGRGLGRRLCAAAAAKLSRDGLSSMCVEVLQGSPSRFFYEAMGGRLAARARHPLAGTVLPTLIYGWDDISQLAVTPA